MITHIYPSNNGAKCIKYLLSHKGHHQEVRNDYIEVLNLNPDKDIISQMTELWENDCSNKLVQIYMIMISFSLEECSPSNEGKKKHLINVAKNALAELYPSHPALLCLQTDGASHLVHIHAAVCPIDRYTGEHIPPEKTTFRYIRNNMNWMFAKKGLKTTKRKDTGYTKNKNYTWVDDIKTRVDSALKEAKTYCEFKCLLGQKGIIYDDNPRRKYNTFTLTDLSQFEISKTPVPKKNLKVRGKRLGESYTKEAIYSHYDLV